MCWSLGIDMFSMRLRVRNEVRIDEIGQSALFGLGACCSCFVASLLSGLTKPLVEFQTEHKLQVWKCRVLQEKQEWEAQCGVVCKKCKGHPKSVKK